MMDNNERAIVPITEALPELRSAQYADVCRWDAEILAADEAHDAYTGERLSKIQAELAPKGLFGPYLRVRGIPETTARRRIAVYLGRTDIYKRGTLAANVGQLPAHQPVLAWSAPIQPAYDEEPDTPEEDDGWPPPDRSEEEPPIMPSEPEPEAPPAVPSVVTFSVEAWEEMHPDLRLSVLEEGREGKAGLNQQKSDSIEWALWSWNPVTGCLHNCPYCYARDIATRFYPQGFKPTFHPYRLGAPIHQKVPAIAEQELGYRNIFTCSMADLFGKWVPAEWIEAVLGVIRDCPQWNFLLLTKFPNRLAEFEFPANAWLGTSVDCQARVKNAERSFARVQGGIKWLSIEPMLEPLKFDSLSMFDWVVIGGASKSTETAEWIPPRRWVMDLEHQAAAAGCMIYEKTNLGVQGPSRLREYPGWERPQATLPPSLKYLPSIG